MASIAKNMRILARQSSVLRSFSTRPATFAVQKCLRANHGVVDHKPILISNQVIILHFLTDNITVCLSVHQMKTLSLLLHLSGYFNCLLKYYIT